RRRAEVVVRELFELGLERSDVRGLVAQSLEPPTLPRAKQLLERSVVLRHRVQGTGSRRAASCCEKFRNRHTAVRIGLLPGPSLAPSHPRRRPGSVGAACGPWPVHRGLTWTSHAVSARRSARITYERPRLSPRRSRAGMLASEGIPSTTSER